MAREREREDREREEEDIERERRRIEREKREEEREKVRIEREKREKEREKERERKIVKEICTSSETRWLYFSESIDCSWFLNESENISLHTVK